MLLIISVKVTETVKEVKTSCKVEYVDSNKKEEDSKDKKIRRILAGEGDKKEGAEQVINISCVD